jgi:hypothetical protein
MSRVAHYEIDMVSNLYKGYGIEFWDWIWFDVMLVGWLVHGIEKGQVRK